jgi:N-acetylglutamate synthase-like GNAT family acetyltransferase
MKSEHTAIIRRATQQDAPVLSELACRSKAHWGYSKVFMDKCRDELLVTAQCLKNKNRIYNLAELNGELAAYYCLERSSSFIWELDALFVEPSFIGKGLGRQLMEHAKHTVIEAGGTKLLVQADPHATEFYKAMGCKALGRRESGSIQGRHLPLFELDL